ncbi:MAG: substrate-binding domain-containing protein [Rhodospirillaceae bacterium]
MSTIRVIFTATFIALAGPALAADPEPVPQSRAAIKVLASPLQLRFTTAVSDRLVKKYGLPPLEVTSMLAAPAVKAFCAGVGPATPDVVAIPRQMAKREYNQCVENGVIDIVELPIGFDALVPVVRKGDPVFNLTPRAMYYALAADIPIEDGFTPNTAKRWRDLDPRLPDQAINVLGSENGTSINAFFKEIFIEGGCRGLRQFKVYYSAEDRVKTCTTLREDGRFTGIKAPIAVNFKPAMEKAPPGAVAVVPYTVYQHNAEWLDLMPVNGVLPSDLTIKNDDYEAVSPVRYYVKRKHMEPSLGGIGVVSGLYKFIEAMMSEEAIGSGGYLDLLGLVIDDQSDRQRDREAAMRLQPFRR